MILCANPAAQFHSYKDEIEAAVLKVFRSNRYILGDESYGMIFFDEI